MLKSSLTIIIMIEENQEELVEHNQFIMSSKHAL